MKIKPGEMVKISATVSKSVPSDTPKTIKFEISEDAKAYILAGDGSIIVEFEPIGIG
ncbi:hypothetical protein SPSYN_01654 [Sporotomaculum syntrophicum]|uniref:Uncharacterized protein n=1 Tax=Sporotomaculum syntrophicum TaxID=182264 RepID=A0A9D3AYJ6_9FIRM|nr:hypothetical protein [Sporotomaculum syntrophicum]KAF1085511.1 hypothetical protein SPSYN_01654 [Sporotomaculum syntrophicum]